jgi:Holliday junction resolvase-like predicted endonuclease
MRRSNQFSRPRERLHSNQFYRIATGYEWWARGKKFWDREVRFDLIEYYLRDNLLILLEDAFRP